MDKLKQFIRKYEGLLLFIIADIFITVETVWFIELIHLVTIDSPSSLLWQGGLGYLISLVVSYYFVKNIIFSIDGFKLSRFIKYWTINTLITIIWKIPVHIAYYFNLNNVIIYVLCYLLGKLIMYNLYRKIVFDKNYRYSLKWAVLFVIALLAIPVALQQALTSSYHLLKTNDYAVTVVPTVYLKKDRNAMDQYDPGWGEEYILKMDEEWFDEDPSEYNPELAYTCSILSSASYPRPGMDDEEADAKIEDLYAQLGFDWINTTSYYYRSKTFDKYINLFTGESNGAAYVVAGKRLSNDRKLIAVSICGSVTVDFVDDLEMGLNRDYELEGHAGFYNAANEIVSGFMENKNMINDKTIVLFTGHSRGGGVANVAAAMMMKKYDEIGIHPTVMAYTIACPNTAGRLVVEQKNYDTIFNIINPYDIVPRVPFKTMGLTRFGHDVSLKELCNNHELINHALEEVKRIFDLDVYLDYSEPSVFNSAMNNIESLYTPDFLNIRLGGNVIKTIKILSDMDADNYLASHKLKVYMMLLKPERN